MREGTRLEEEVVAVILVTGNACLNCKGSCRETTDRGNTEEAGLWPHPGPNYSTFIPLWYIR